MPWRARSSLLDKLKLLDKFSSVKWTPVASRAPVSGSGNLEWTRTQLTPGERDELSNALTPAERAHLTLHDYVWVAGTGVLWHPPGGGLSRARFTHGIHFDTKRGEHYVDSEGSVRVLFASEPGAV